MPGMRTVAVVLVGLGLLGACGNSKDGKAKDASSKATTTTVAGAAAASTTVDTAFTGKGSADFCAKATRYEHDFEQSASAESPDALRRTYADQRVAVADLVDAAPSEIKDDAKTLQAYLVKTDDYLKTYGYDFSKIPPNDPAAPGTPTPEVQTASTRLGDYLRNVCQIPLGGTTTTEPAGASDANAADDSTSTTSP